MTKVRVAVATAIAGGLIAVPAITMAATASAPKAAADPLLKVCLTVQEKHLTVTVNGTPIVIGGPIAVPTTCLSV